jgi:dihydrofolate reductase
LYRNKTNIKTLLNKKRKENKMRKIIVLSFITLDGVMQAPGAPEEDRSGGFKFGGWLAPYNDKAYNKVMQEHMKPTDILLGRKTFEIFASYWPEHAANWPGINDVKKYVVSKTMKKSDPIITGWENSILLKSIADIKKLKNEPAGHRRQKPIATARRQGSKSSDIKVWGSSKLIQSLLKNDLVDELWLKIHPLTLGKGKKLFDDGIIPAAFTLIESSVTPGGVIIANYKRAGKVRTGTVGA